jgi:predicted nucleic acid-binding Zn ribbon protein
MGKRRKRESQVLEVWEEVVGTDRVSKLAPLRLRQGVLWVSVESPALLYEVSQFEREAIVGRLKELLPKLAVEDVRFRLA